MRRSLQKKLFAEFDFLRPFGTLNDTLMHFGVETDSGWYKLIRDLSSAIAEELKDSNIKNFRVLQIKEKFSGLRYYYVGGNSRIFDLVCKAERESFNVCELCGAVGESMVKNGLYKTLCSKCVVKLEKKDRKKRFGIINGKWEPAGWIFENV